MDKKKRLLVFGLVGIILIAGLIFAAVCDSDSDCSSGYCNPSHPDAGADGCVVGGGSGCTDNSECNDGNVCTTDMCSGGICYNTAISNCCTYDSQCNDGNVCTTDSCVNNQCSNVMKDCGTSICNQFTGECLKPICTTCEVGECNSGNCYLGVCLPSGHTLADEDCLKKECEICTINSDCKSNLCATTPNGNKRCTNRECTYDKNGDLLTCGIPDCVLDQNSECRINHRETICSDSNTQETCSYGSWISLNCPAGCDSAKGTCNPGSLPNCATGCVSDENCEGRCAELPNRTKICIPADKSCGLESANNCGVVDLTETCYDGNLYQCDGKEQWGLKNVCAGGCSVKSGGCVPTIIWQTTSGGITTSIDLVDSNTLGTINIRLQNYASLGIKTTTFKITEKDPLYSDNIRDIIGTNQGDDLVATWEITSDDLEAAINPLQGDFETDEVFEFQVEIGGIVSQTLLATKTFDSCSNNQQDYGEEGVDCGDVCGNGCQPTSCFDGQQNNDETSIDCGGSCGSCSKEALWTSPNKDYSWYNDSVIRHITVNDLVEGNVKFRMLLNDPTSENAEFVLKEDDTIRDDTLATELYGSFDTNNNLEYIWTPTISQFWDAGLTETTYEFYFEVDGETSTNLLVELDETLPTCDDEIMNGDEVDVDCGGSCPNQDCVSVCFTNNVCADYIFEDSCNTDICNVAENSVMDLGADEIARCDWNIDTCNAIKNLTYNGHDIGDCVYVEDTTTDNCDDGFLSYSWDSYVDWAEGNTYLTQTACESAVGDSCIQDSLGWHYDPLDYIGSCIPGSQTIPCPAQIQLNFFNWKNFFAAALLVLIIYIILKNSKTFKKTKKNITKKKSGKKKVVKKKK